MIFFSIGLFVQDLEPAKKISLILSMFILASIAIIPCCYIQSVKDIKNISNGILIGIFISIILALISDTPLTTGASEGLFLNYGFNGGMEHRNYFAYTLLASYFSIYTVKERSRKDKLLLILNLVLLISTNSRSAYVILLLFVAISYINKIKQIDLSRNILDMIFIITLILLGVLMFRLLIHYSETFYFRTKGLINYLDTYSRDIYHLVFGNAEMAFHNERLSYDENIRSVIGWDGSTELVILNILIKNGLLGFIGYFIIYQNYFKRLSMLKDRYFHTHIFAILVTFLISAFVESFLANINYTYTVCNYLILCNIFLHAITRKEMGRENNSILPSTISHNT